MVAGEEGWWLRVGDWGGGSLLDAAAGLEGLVGFSRGERDLWAPGWMQHI